MHIRKAVYSIILTCSTAFGVAVNVPLDDVSVNLGLLFQVGHYYRYRDTWRESLDYSRFDVGETELRVYGMLFDRVEYGVRYNVSSFSSRTSLREAFVGTELPAGFSVKIGKYFLPFGVEATTESGYLTCTSWTKSSTNIALGRGYGIRFDYSAERDNWPYKVGAAAGVFNGSSPLVAGAGRVYGTPIPGVRDLEVGYSYYYRKEAREKYRLTSSPRIEYLEEPRAGADARLTVSGLTLSAEYMQRFYNDFPIEPHNPLIRDYAYKSAYDRGYFGTVNYYRELPWRYFQGFQPYGRYEHFDPAILYRGYTPVDRYTGGFALHFLGRNLMFKSDYTRVLEETNPTSNDEITSEFQVMF